MTDNVVLPGTGESIATDDISGAQYQRIKVSDGLADSTTHMRVLTTHPLPNTAGAVVRQAPAEIWVTGFSKVGASLLETDKFTQRRLGTGMGVTQSGGNLLLTTGTTANSEFLARSTTSWRGPLTARYKTILSQRIANQNFVMLLADSVGEGLTYTNTATTLTITKTAHGFTADNVGQFIYVGGINATSGTAIPGRYAIASITNADTFVMTVASWTTGGGTLDLFGYNFIRSAYSGTTVTNASVDAQRNGWNSGDTAATINTTASPGHMMQMFWDSRNIAWADTLVASGTSPTVTTRASRVENMPDDEIELYWFIWMFNGSTAPASTTTWTVSFVAVEDNANVPTYIAGARPLGTQAPLPVSGVGTFTVSFTQPALVAGTAAIGDVGVQYRANATGAASGTHLVSAATTNPTVVKASAGRLLGYVLTNNAASKVYVKFHNQTTSPTAGSGVVRSVGIPAGGTVAWSLEGGVAFATGIALTTVTGAADADNTAVALNDIVGDIFFA
jgi:hypothetical protein